MASRRFTLTTTVPARPEQAIDFLADLPRHVGLHPYLVSAEAAGSGVGEDGPWRDFVVTERPRLWRLRYTMRFPARVVRTSPTSMRSVVRALPGCHLSAVTRATGSPGDHTDVTEETTVTAPLLVLGYMLRSARTAHARTFALLAESLAGPDAGPARRPRQPR